MAHQHESGGYLVRALRTLEAAERACPTDAGRAKLLELQVELGMEKQARALAASILSTAPAESPVRTTARRALAELDRAAAPPGLEAQASVLATLDRAWRARTSRRVGDEERAESLFAEAVERWPTHPPALVGLGLMRRARGDEVAARRLFDRAVVLAEHDTGSEVRIAMTDVRCGFKNVAVAGDGSVALDCGHDVRVFGPDGHERCRHQFPTRVAASGRSHPTPSLLRSVQFDGASRRLALVAEDGSARVLDGFSCRTLWEASPPDAATISHLAFADDDGTLVTVAAGAIEVIGMKTPPPPRLVVPDDCTVAALGLIAAPASPTSGGTAPLRLWVGCQQGDLVAARIDAQAAAIVARIARPAGVEPPLLGVAPHGSMVVAAYARGAPFVELDESGRVLWRAPDDGRQGRRWPHDVALSAQADALLGRAQRGLAHWSRRNGRWRMTPFADRSNLRGNPAVSPDGAWAVARCDIAAAGTSADRRGVCRWPLSDEIDRHGYQHWEVYPPGAGVRRLVRSADGSALIVLDPTGTLRRWSLAGGTLWSAPRAVPGFASSSFFDGIQHTSTRFRCTIAISADGTRWGHGGYGKGGTNSACWFGSAKGPHCTVDARSVAFVTGLDAVTTSPPMRLWNAESGEVIAEEPTSVNPGRGRLLLSTASARPSVAELRDGTLSVWQLSPLQEIMRVELPAGEPRALALSATATLVAARWGDHATAVWSVANGRRLCTLSDQRRALALVFADDTQLLSATASWSEVKLTRRRANACEHDGVVELGGDTLPSYEQAGSWNVGALHSDLPQSLLFTVGPRVAAATLSNGTLQLTRRADGAVVLLRAARDADGGVVVLPNGTFDLLGSDQQAAARLLRCHVGDFSFPLWACEGLLRREGALRAFYEGQRAR